MTLAATAAGQSAQHLACVHDPREVRVERAGREAADVLRKRPLPTATDGAQSQYVVERRVDGAAAAAAPAPEAAQVELRCIGNGGGGHKQVPEAVASDEAAAVVVAAQGRRVAPISGNGISGSQVTSLCGSIVGVSSAAQHDAELVSGTAYDKGRWVMEQAPAVRQGPEARASKSGSPSMAHGTLAAPVPAAAAAAAAAAAGRATGCLVYTSRRG